MLSVLMSNGSTLLCLPGQGECNQTRATNSQSEGLTAIKNAGHGCANGLPPGKALCTVRLAISTWPLLRH